MSRNVSYGLDCSSQAMTVVRAVRQRKKLVFETVLSQQNAATQRVEERLKQAAPDLMNGRAVSTAALPVRDSFLRWLKTPFQSPSKARKVLPSLLDIQLPFPLEQCTYDFVQYRKSADGHVDALAMAARSDQLADFENAFLERGVQPQAITHEGLALWSRSVEEIPLERESHRVVAYIGEDRSAFVVGNSGGIVSAHGSRVGALELTDTASQHKASQQLITRAQQILRAYAGSVQELQWVWCGPGAAAAPSVEPLLQEITPLQFARHKDPETFLARALAAAALSGAPRSVFPDTGKGMAGSVYGDMHRKAAGLFIAGGLALCAVNLAWLGTLEFNKQRMQHRVTALAKSLSGMEDVYEGQEVYIVEGALAERAERMQPIRNVFKPSLLEPLRNLMSTAGEMKLRIETLSLRDDSISIRGSSPDWSSCEPLASELEAHGFRVKLNRKDAGADERVHFSLSGERTP